MSIDGLLNQIAVIYPKTGYNKLGRDISSTTATQVQCRFQNNTRLRTGKDGATIQLLGIIYFSGDTVLSTEDRIVTGGVSYKAFSITGGIDGAGRQRLIKCEVQKWQTT